MNKLIKEIKKNGFIYGGMSPYINIEHYALTLLRNDDRFHTYMIFDLKTGKFFFVMEKLHGYRVVSYKDLKRNHNGLNSSALEHINLIAITLSMRLKMSNEKIISYFE